MKERKKGDIKRTASVTSRSDNPLFLGESRAGYLMLKIDDVSYVGIGRMHQMGPTVKQGESDDRSGSLIHMTPNCSENWEPDILRTIRCRHYITNELCQFKGVLVKVEKSGEAEAGRQFGYEAGVLQIAVPPASTFGRSVDR